MSKYTYSYSIYDADPAACDVDAWPEHDDETIEADDAGEARDLVRDALDVCAASCDPADGYEVGDVLHALVWDTDGQIVATLRRELTAEDLGVTARRAARGPGWRGCGRLPDAPARRACRRALL